MGSKNRDLTELAQFQLKAVEFCQKLTQLGQKLLTDTQEASACLQDDVSKVSLNRVETVAEKLLLIGEHGQHEMTIALTKTRAEMERWNDL